jgi:SAM-dependent methyltransferase
VDVGCGEGRVARELTAAGHRVVGIEASPTLADAARDADPGFEVHVADAAELPLEDGVADLAVASMSLFNVDRMPAAVREIARVLEPGGTFVLEFANSANALRRLKLLAKGKSVPREPISLRSHLPRSDDEIPFVNHNPRTVLAQLDRAGFDVEQRLSGSNLRSPRLKRALSARTMLAAERWLQPVLAPVWFGPSVWLRLRKRPLAL